VHRLQRHGMIVAAGQRVLCPVLPLSFLNWAYVRQIQMRCTLILGVRYAGLSIFGVLCAKPSNFQRNFRLTQSEEDVCVVLVTIAKDRPRYICKANVK